MPDEASRPECVWLESYLDGKLEKKAAEKFEAHLPVCYACSMSVALVNTIQEALEEVVENPKKRRSRIVYPTRCRIVDVTGKDVFPGVAGNTPDVSKPHLGKKGTADLVPHDQLGEAVRIVLDDGSELMGYECWWEPLNETVEDRFDNLILRHIKGDDSVVKDIENLVRGPENHIRVVKHIKNTAARAREQFKGTKWLEEVEKLADDEPVMDIMDILNRKVH